MKRLKAPAKFVVCVRTNDSEDLEQRKLYQVLPDRAASRAGLVRVVDESGEDYLYPTDYFVPVRLPAIIADEFELPIQPQASGASRRQTKARVRVARR